MTGVKMVRCGRDRGQAVRVCIPGPPISVFQDLVYVTNLGKRLLYIPQPHLQFFPTDIQSSCVYNTGEGRRCCCPQFQRLISVSPDFFLKVLFFLSELFQILRQFAFKFFSFNGRRSAIACPLYLPVVFEQLVQL